MTFLRALHAEFLKIKRTIALKMVLVAPAVVLLLSFFVISQGPYSTITRFGSENEWASLLRFNLRFWTFLMFPLYITLESALVTGLDHAENQWKSLLARPVPRWTFYIAKFAVVLAMIAVSSLVMAAGVLLDGATLPRVQPELTFAAPVPWLMILRVCSLTAGLALLMFAIQYWISMRWRSFSVAVGAGIVAMVAGAFGAMAGQSTDSWPQYIPWSLPILVTSRQTHGLDAALWISAAAAVALTAAGCLEFSRREIQ